MSNFITVKELSIYTELSPRTITYKIAELKKKRKFKKEYDGRNYTVKEAQRIIKLLKLPIDLKSAIKRNKPQKRGK